MKSYIKYTDILNHLPIAEGSVLLVSSDILKLICVCRENGENFNAHLFIDTILQKVGEKGTVLFPTFFWHFCSGTPFDYKSSASQTGGLSNIALKRSDFRRTKHPIYSFAVWGKDCDELCEADPLTSFGADSPFDYLYHCRAKNLFIGIDYKNGFTSVHYAEEKVGVPYRYYKEFEGDYIAEDGQKKKISRQMYVRNRDVITEIGPALDEELFRNGFYQRFDINGIYFGLIDMRGIGEIMENDLRGPCRFVYPRKL